ncbi:MAG: TonB-dependent receptor plug domain-containing protein [Rhodothermales bacterium]
MAAALRVDPAAAQPTDPPPGVQIITAEDIEQAGLARLSDLFTLINDWYATSVKGYSWDASANGLASLQEASWLLLIDGHPVDLKTFFGQNINTLPVSLSQIAYVEVINTPTFVQGLFAQSGVLHLHTREPERGTSFQGSFAAGNEVGDPGPFRYTDFATLNIDRIGPTLQAAVSYGGPTTHLRAHFKSDEHHATDERIRQRVFTTYQGEKSPRLLLTAGGFDLATTGRLGHHRVFGGFARYQDLPFFEPIGIEAPNDHRFTHAGLRGEFFPGQPSGISYRLSYSSSELATRNNRGGIRFDWKQNLFRGQYEVRYALEHLQGALGLSIDHREIVTDASLDTPTLTIPRAYGRLMRQTPEAGQQLVEAYLTRIRGEIGFGAVTRWTISPTPAHTLILTGSIARKPYQEHHTLWYWMSEGYSFRADRESDVRLPSGFDAATAYTADLAWTYRPSDRFAVSVSGGYRRFENLTLAEYSHAFDSLTTGLFTRTNVRNHLSGQTTRVSAEIRFRVIPSLEQRLYYGYLRYPTKDESFFQAWRNLPWHRLSYEMRFVPLSRLSLFARLSYVSETQWTGFFQAAEVSGNRYEARLPASWLLDLSIQKRLWRDHIQLNLSLRNFLNEPYRPHPAGAITNMALHARVRVYFTRRPSEN